MSFTGEARYGDWVERLLYNGILAALPMAPKGQTFYYSDYRVGGGRKIYHLDGTWPCCSGTYPQVVSDYHDVVYFRNAAGLLVNLYVPSRVRWNQAGAEVTVEQSTSYPASEATTLTVRGSRPGTFDLRFRVPAWMSTSTRGASAEVNGEAASFSRDAGGWGVLRRAWRDGDRVTLRFPMALALAPVDAQHPKRVAVTYGPLVLVRPDAPLPGPPGGDLSAWLARRGSGLEFAGPVPDRGSFVPFYGVGGGVPYQMYFDLA